MDFDFRPSKVHSFNHRSSQLRNWVSRFSSRFCWVLCTYLRILFLLLKYGNYDDNEGDEDARACFLCPFCYVEIQIRSLCNHLQEDHCFDLKNAVCPLCAANFGKDVIRHFMVQHASSLKLRRKAQKSGVWSGSPAMLGRELTSFIGSSTAGLGNAYEFLPDPFVSDTKDVQQDKCSDDEPALASNLKRIEPRLLDKDYTEKRRQRAAFVQEMVMSIIF